MVDSLFYPKKINIETFQKFFLKINLFDVASENTTAENKNKRVLKSIVYLPLPKGLLREEFQLDYNREELGVLGEIVKNKYDAVSKSIKNIVKGQTLSLIDDEGNAYDSARDYITQNGINILDTFLEQQIARTDNYFLKIGAQATGYSRAPNFTLLFDGVSRVREFTLEWKISPKNEDDAEALENIIVTLQKATLPKLTQFNLLSNGLKFLEDYAQTTFKSVLAEQQLTAESKPEAVQKSADVKDKFPKVAENLFSSTFKLPFEMELEIVEKQGNELKKVDYLMDFPHKYLIRDISAYYGVNSETETFIKGKKGYYHQSYDITMIIMENKIYTADDVR